MDFFYFIFFNCIRLEVMDYLFKVVEVEFYSFL